MYDVAIIGCGVVGAAAAQYLARRRLRLCVLEAENDVADGTTKANSAILHAGYDPAPGTLMARLNVRGAALARELCAVLDVPRKETGSLVLAFAPEEVPHVEELYRRGLANGVEGLRILSGEEVAALEPNLAPVQAALLAPSAAIVNPWEYALALAENAVENGAELQLNCPVTGAQPLDGGGWRLHTARGEVDARFVVNAAGVAAQRVHEMAAPANFRTVPCRGEYYLLDKSAGGTVQHVIFQCPSKEGKGVLVAPTVHGNLIVGPNAEDADSTANTAQGLAQVAEKARRSVPGLDLSASIRNFAGVRANTDRGDFVIQWAAPGFLDLAGMQSPGLTAAPAVAEYAAGLLEEAGLVLAEKPAETLAVPRKKIRFRELSRSEQAALIARQPAYGRVICRCETITEGEILAACREPIPPCSIDGVKRRAGAGMGRCQGGFCSPRVLEILSRELGRSPLDIPQDKAGSFILTGRTKQAPAKGGEAQ